MMAWTPTQDGPGPLQACGLLPRGLLKMRPTIKRISTPGGASAAGNGALRVFGSRGFAPRMADDDRKRKSDQGGPGTAVVTKTRPKTKRPSLYRVLLLNDDYTPMEFVVHVLERFFQKGREEATQHHAACASARRGRVRRLHLRGGRDQGDAGHGLRPQASASAAMRDGKEVRFTQCRHSPAVSKRPCIRRWRSPTSATRNTRRSSICCWR